MLTKFFAAATTATVEKAAKALAVADIGWWEKLGKVADAFSALAWPLLAIAAVIVLNAPIRKILNSIGERGGSLKLGSSELTVPVGDANLPVAAVTKQQQGMIEDLQKQLKLVSDRIDTLHGAVAPVHGATDTLAATEILNTTPVTEKRAHPRILWVDDHPENNSVLVATLRARGFDIDLALSQSEADAQFSAGRYNAVITDMGREKPDSGVETARRIRAIDTAVPVYVFCSGRATTTFGDAARAAGATVVTDSATVVSQAMLALQAV